MNDIFRSLTRCANMPIASLLEPINSSPRRRSFVLFVGPSKEETIIEGNSGSSVPLDSKIAFSLVTSGLSNAISSS